MDIKLSQIKDFKSFESFSYNENGQDKTYSTSNKIFRFSKPYLAVDKDGDVVIHFQNAISRFFSSLVHTALTRLHIPHCEVTDPEGVWKAMQKRKIIDQSEEFPVKEGKNVRQLFASKISQFVNPPSPTHVTSDNSMEAFQKYAFFAEQSFTKEAKIFLNDVKDLNGYFAKAIDTPLTLAVKKENFELVEYLLVQKDKDGNLLVDPNKTTIDEQSPLLLAAKKDLPRRFFMALFQAGAVPRNEKEAKAIIAAAGGQSHPDRNRPLIQAITDLSEGRKVSWPAPEADAIVGSDPTI